jgi:adenylate kinase
MVIIVTGTPGTGKTTYAKALAQQLGYRYLDLHEFIVAKGLAEEKDVERDSLIIDEQALVEALLPTVVARPETVVDGHLSYCVPPEHVTKCVVTKCELKELKTRLEARGYSEAKVRENLDAEIFDVCLHDSAEHGHKPEVVWTSSEAAKDAPDANASI